MAELEKGCVLHIQRVDKFIHSKNPTNLVWFLSVRALCNKFIHCTNPLLRHNSHFYLDKKTLNLKLKLSGYFCYLKLKIKLYIYRKIL